MKRIFKHSIMVLAASFGLVSCVDYMEQDKYVSPASEPLFTLVNNSGLDIAWCIPYSADAFKDTIQYSTAGTIAAMDSTNILCGEVANYWAKDTLRICVFNYRMLMDDASEKSYDDPYTEIIFSPKSPSYLQTISLTAPDLVKLGRRVVIK